MIKLIPLLLAGILVSSTAYAERRGEPVCRRDPDAVYKGHGTCVHRDTDRAEIQEIMPDIKGDPKCDGRPGYYARIYGPHGAVGVMWRTCHYHKD